MYFILLYVFFEVVLKCIHACILKTFWISFLLESLFEVYFWYAPEMDIIIVKCMNYIMHYPRFCHVFCFQMSVLRILKQLCQLIRVQIILILVCYPEFFDKYSLVSVISLSVIIYHSIYSILKLSCIMKITWELRQIDYVL